MHTPNDDLVDVSGRVIAHYRPGTQSAMRQASGRYLMLDMLQTAAIGRQSAAPRIAAFLRTSHRRLREIGEAMEAKMAYRLRQQDLADILGMTQVHVSRTLRGFCEAGILILNGKTVTMLNHAKLERLAKS